jgi:small-conductance mechanosensitive channel
MTWLQTNELWGNTFLNWIVAASVFGVSFVGLIAIKAFLRTKIEKWASRKKSDIRDLLHGLIRSTYLLIVLAFSLFLGASFLELGDKANRIIQSLLILNVLLQMIFWANQFIDYALNRLLKKRSANGTQDTSLKTIMPTLKFVLRLFVVLTVTLLALDNLGFNITTLIAGLGVGGIAVALAVQNILGDLFASLSIVLDKPFEVGDAIQVGEYIGTVEKIGLKTTRLRNLYGEQLVFANSQLLSTSVRNYKRMQRRRQVFSIGVTYETPTETVARIPEILRAAVESLGPRVSFDRAHFQSFGAFSLDFEVVYFSESQEFNAFMDAQQQINLNILREFAKEGIEFAYPTQVHYNRVKQL